MGCYITLKQFYLFTYNWAFPQWHKLYNIRVSKICMINTISTSCYFKFYEFEREEARNHALFRNLTYLCTSLILVTLE